MSKIIQIAATSPTTDTVETLYALDDEGNIFEYYGEFASNRTWHVVPNPEEIYE